MGLKTTALLVLMAAWPARADVTIPQMMPGTLGRAEQVNAATAAAAAKGTADAIAALGPLIATPSSNAALTAVPTATLAAGASVFRAGFAVAGDGGAARYTYSPTACSISGGDGGTQVPAAAGGCWNVDPTAPITVELFAGKIGVPYAADGTATIDAQPALQKALDTGKTVHLGGFVYYVKRQSTITTPSQQIVGEGRKATILDYGTDFSTANGSAIIGTSPAVFSGTGQPGPIIRDFTIKGFQPAVPSTYANRPAIDAALATLIQVSCIDVRDVLASKVSAMVVATCLRGIDMRGNSGQTVIDDVQGSNFIADIDIDGATDSVRISNAHTFPFGLTAGQYALAHANGTGIKSGKADDLKVSNSMTISPGAGIYLFAGTPRTLAIDGYTSPGGQTTGSVSNYDFDVMPVGLKIDAGALTVTGGYFASLQAVQINGGYLGLSNTSITVNQDGAITQTGGYMILNSSHFADYNSDYTAVTQTGGTLVFNGNLYDWGKSGNTTKPKVNAVCCRLMATGNLVNDFGTGTHGSAATFFTVNPGNYNLVTNNLMPGWTNSP